MASLAAAAAKFGKELVTKHGPGILEAVEEKTSNFIGNEVNRLKKKLNRKPNNPNPNKRNKRYNPIPIGNAPGKNAVFGHSPM